MVARVPDRKGHDRRYSLDDHAAARHGLRPAIPFRQGLKATVGGIEANRAWWEPLKQPGPDAAAGLAVPHSTGRAP